MLVKDKEFAGQKRFVPYINSMFVAPVLLIGIWALILYYNHDATHTFFTDFTPTADDLKKGISTATGVFFEKLPYFVFIIFSLGMATLCVIKRLSLIPVLGVMCCTYLMTELGWTNWLRFGIWLIAGLVIYFFYSYSHSKLNKAPAETAA